MDVREKLVDDIHSKLMGLLQRAPYIRCEDVHRQYAVNWLMNNSVTVQEMDGCEYCKEDSEGFRRMFGAFSLVNPFHGKTWQIHAGKCKPREINFCPMCGRRLPQPPKGE